MDEKRETAMHDAIEYPPFAHSFVAAELTPQWLRDNCYVVTREHYAALLADRDEARAVNDQLLGAFQDERASAIRALGDSDA